jgi:hypothetical protein
LKKKKKKAPQALFKTDFFDVRLPQNTETSLLKHGPMEVFALCVEGEVLITVSVTNDSTEALGVFGVDGDDGFDDVIETEDIYAAVASDSTEGFRALGEDSLWEVEGSGNDSGNGAVGTSTGFYVSVDGETAIGMASDKDAVLSTVYGEDVACVFMGVISVFKHAAWKGIVTEIEL